MNKIYINGPEEVDEYKTMFASRMFANNSHKIAEIITNKGYDYLSTALYIYILLPKDAHLSDEVITQWTEYYHTLTEKGASALLVKSL